MNDSLSFSVRRSRLRTAEKVRFLTAEDILSHDVPTVNETQNIPLRQLAVNNLLSFGDLIDFNFGRLNLLVGPNGSGKSNLINCIRIAKHCPFGIQDAFMDTGFEDWLYKGNRNKAASLSMTSMVPGVVGELRHELRFGSPVNSRAPLEEVITGLGSEEDREEQYFAGSYRSNAHLTSFATGKRRRSRKLSSEEYDPYQSILSQIRDQGQYPEITKLANFYSQFRIYSEWTFGRNSNLREATPTNRSSNVLSESMDDLPIVLNSLENTTAHEAIRTLLGQLKPSYVDFITRLVYGRIGLELKESPFEGTIPAKRLSDGTLRFLALAAILLQPSPPALICLEEPELGMHPDMIRMVARMIIEASSQTQLIVSTHSEQLLTDLQEDFDVLFTFDSGPTGSAVNQLSRADYLEWRADHNLGELWSSGEIGGVRY